jgi:hypothetical protein
MLGQNDEKKFARLIEMVLNEAMKLERTEALKSQPYERTDVDSQIKLNKPSHDQFDNFASKLNDRAPCGCAAG